jgi:mannosyl-3-phosphoglycerate phosphatase
MGLIIFSDLDGTLLDHHTYSWQAAAAALEALEERGVPLILCSSKTRAEMMPLQAELGISGPLICENGGGIFAPQGHPITQEPGWSELDEQWMVRRIGMPITELLSRFASFKERFGARGFHDMSAEEVAGLTGLSLEKAALAKQREFNEPVLLPDPASNQADFISRANQAGLKVTRGGRFLHLLGGGDKGKAVKLVSQYYRNVDPSVTTMALGDAPNDAAMLKEVDQPVLVARPGGGHAGLEIVNLYKSKKVGPEGWNQAVLLALSGIG